MKTIDVSVTASGTRDQVNAAVATQVKQHSGDPVTWPVAIAIRDAVNRAVPTGDKGAPEKQYSVAAKVTIEIKDAGPAAAPAKGRGKAEDAKAE